MVAVRAEDHYLESHLKQFADQGYTVVRGVFSPDEVSVMLAASERVIGKVRADPMSFDPPTVPRFTSRAVGELDTWGVDNMFAPRLYDPASPDRHPDGGRGQSDRAWVLVNAVRIAMAAKDRRRLGSSTRSARSCSRTRGTALPSRSAFGCSKTTSAAWRSTE